MFLHLFLLSAVLDVLCKFSWDGLTGLAQEGRRLGSQGLEGEEIVESILLFLLLVGLCIVLAIVGQLVFACAYEAKVVKQRARLPEEGVQCARPNGDFNYELRSCFDDAPICLHALFCPACRAGDTYAAAGVSSYREVIALYVVAHVVGQMVGGFLRDILGPGARDSSSPGRQLPHIVTSILVGLLFYNKRRELRRKIGGSDEAASWFTDFVFWGLFGCCVISQEARSLDAIMGVRVECCCNLVCNAARDPLVGNPVVAAVPPVQGNLVQMQEGQQHAAKEQLEEGL